MKGRILIVDDEKLTRATLEMQMADEGFEVRTATNGFDALTALDEGSFDVMITDLRMPSMDGMALSRVVQERWPDTAVVVLTAFGTVATAVQAMRDGAADYLTKPINFDDLLIRVRRLVARRREIREIRQLREAAARGVRVSGLIYRSSAMRRVVERALAVAESNATVLLTGETGTGKGVLAQVIHENSERRHGPFVTVNCAELNPNLIESELFGHEAGAFTGALRQRQGRFEAAFGGTLFIDEVDDLPSEIQVRLLRFLQDRTFERVGSSKTLKGDVRVVAATKQSLPDLVASKGFREDLYYRINAVSVQLPPLRDRAADILALAEHFASQLADPGHGRPEFLPEAEQVLLAHDWPGNVRELKHAVEHAVTFARGAAIGVAHLPEQLRPVRPRSVVSLDLEGRDAIPFDEIVAQCERELLDWALAKTAGNQVQAARILELSRTTLRGRLAALGNSVASSNPDAEKEED